MERAWVKGTANGRGHDEESREFTCTPIEEEWQEELKLFAISF